VSLSGASGEKTLWDKTTIEFVQEAVVAKDEDPEDSPTSSRTTSHLKLSFTHIEVENKAKLSLIPL